MQETITMELNTVLNGVLLVGIGIISYFLKSIHADYIAHKKEHKDHREKVTTEINTVKLNYLDRFAKLTEGVTNTREGLTKEINDSEKRLTQLIISQKK